MLKSSSSTTCVTLSLHTSSLQTATAATMTGRESEQLREVAKQLARSKSFQQQKQVHAVVREGSQSNHGSLANVANDNNNASNKNGVAGRKRFKIKDSTKLALKLHVIHEKGVRIEQLLRQLQLATNECHGDLARDMFVRTAVEVEHEVRLAKKLMLLLCSHRLLEEHFSTLMSVPDQMRPTFDISVKFFGMNWEHAFRVTANLLHLVRAMLSVLRRESGAPDANSEEFRLVYPSNILRDLATLEADVVAHTEAVLKNRLDISKEERVIHHEERVEPKTVVVVVEDVDEDRKEVKEELSTPKRTMHPQETPMGAVAEEEEDKSTQRTGNRLVNILRSLQLRLKRRKKKTSHDDLWRMWYLGVQNMTLSVSVNTSEENGSSPRDPIQSSKANEPATSAKDDLCLKRKRSPKPRRRSSVS